VNFPLSLFLAEDEQFVVRFFRHLMTCEDLLFSGRSGAAVRQVSTHIHDLVDRENDVKFEDLEEAFIGRLHRLAANKGGHALGHHDRIAAIKRQGCRRIACVECLLVGLEEVAVAGDRVRFVPFVSGAHFLEVGLLYRQSGFGENIRKLVAACLTDVDMSTLSLGC
jgi:hypothetical protein